MPQNLLQKSLNLLLKRQTNILSAAFVIMGTTVLSLLLGVLKKRLLIAFFSASNIVGVYDAATRLPDAIFQLVIAAALSTAFIPVFSNYLAKNKEKEAHDMASNLLSVGLLIFGVFSIVLAIFAPFFLQFLNLGSGFSPKEMELMVNLLRIVILGQLLFIIGTFFSALLQSYNHFFIAGFAAAMYNIGIILGILLLSTIMGIYSAAYGIVLGALFYIAFQIPFVKKFGFRYKPNFSFSTNAVKTVAKLMWPRTLSMAVIQLGSLLTITLVSFLPNTGRNYFLFDLAQTIAFAPVALIGGSIGQAALPVDARGKLISPVSRGTIIVGFGGMVGLDAYDALEDKIRQRDVATIRRLARGNSEEAAPVWMRKPFLSTMRSQSEKVITELSAQAKMRGTDVKAIIVGHTKRIDNRPIGGRRVGQRLFAADTGNADPVTLNAQSKENVFIESAHNFGQSGKL